jgi:hypothetical protein
VEEGAMEIFLISIILIIIGILTFPVISALIFGPESICFHTNIYLIGLAIIITGIGMIHIARKM